MTHIHHPHFPRPDLTGAWCCVCGRRMTASWYAAHRKDLQLARVGGTGMALMNVKFVFEAQGHSDPEAAMIKAVS